MKIKNFIKGFFVAFVAAMLLNACRDQEIINVDNNTSPELVDLSSRQLVLDQNFQTNPALTVTWSPATYSVPTSINYKLEISKSENFETPVILGLLKDSQRNITFTVKQMNEAAKSIGLLPDVVSKMYMRVTSYLGTSSLYATSKVTSISIKPYKVIYPTFYLVGAASYVGWTASKAQILYKGTTDQTESQSFIYTYLENGQNFRFLGQQDWNPLNYSVDDPQTDASNRYFKTWSSNLVFGDHENMKFIGTTGIYKILIDADPGKKTIDVKASPIITFDIPQVYLVGNVAGNGWNAANAIAMTKTGAGVFEYTTALPANAEFKFLGQKSFGDLDWGNISGSGNSGFLGPKSDNGNITFVGDGSNYKITVNIKAGIYTIEKQ